MGAISLELVRWPDLIRPATRYAALMMGVVALTMALMGLSAVLVFNTVTTYDLAAPVPCQQVTQALSERQATLSGRVRIVLHAPDQGSAHCQFRLSRPPLLRGQRKLIEAEQAQLLDVMRSHGQILSIRSATITRDLWVVPYTAWLLAMFSVVVMGRRWLRSDYQPLSRFGPWISTQVLALLVLWIIIAWPLWIVIDLAFTDRELGPPQAGAWPAQIWLPWLWFVLITPWLEEWFFRGVIYRHFLAHHFRYLGLLISSGGFMLFHWPMLLMTGAWSSPGAHLSLLMISVVCCELYRRAGLWAAVQFHLLHNLAILSLAWHSASMP